MPSLSAYFEYRQPLPLFRALLSLGNLVAAAVLIVFALPLPLPLCKFPLSFFTLIESEDVREDAARNLLDFMLRDAGIVDELFASTQDSPPSYADGDFEGVLGVFEMEKRRYLSSICVVS